jgi:hypothetical protein
MIMYPENDSEYEDRRIDAVEGSDADSYAITCDGWTLYCGNGCPAVPEVGQTARMYGHGIGSPVRGLFINGVRVWYRTEAEDRAHHERELYGADCADWLTRWDGGRGVWSIEMGGLGPGYEQAIQITMAECLRWFVANKPDAALWSDKDEWAKTRDALEKAMHPVVDPLGLSGAQWGAAVNLAAMFYRNGPQGVMADARVKDRHIQISNALPTLTPPARVAAKVA